MRLKDKVALITGAGGGIGRESALLFAGEGAAILVVDVNDKAGTETVALVERAGHRAAYCRADVSKAADCQKMVETAEKTFGRLDVLFNNAGIAVRRSTAELSLDDWNRVVGVNMTGVFLCAREAAKHMRAGGRGGRIVNTASIMGFSGGGLYPNISYQATKGAVVNMTRALAVEWAAQDIRVNGIAPTWIRTALTKVITENPDLLRRIEQLTPMGRIGEPEDIVGAVLYLSTRASALVTGHILAVDGGYLAQ